MFTKDLKEDVEVDDLTSKQRRIIEIALENPDLTNEAIAEEADASASHVSNTHRRFIKRTIHPNQVAVADLDDDDIYEMIVAGIESIKGVERVEREYNLDLHTGDTKEVDVASWVNDAGYEFLAIIECKDHSDRTVQDVVFSVADQLDNSRADRAVVVAREGFQSGSIERARQDNIDLLTMRELRQGDLDGRIAKVRTKVEVFPTTDPDLIGVDLHPVDEDILDEVEEKNLTPYINQSPGLYGPGQRPTEETIFELATAFASRQPAGTHSRRVEDRQMLLDGDFYELRGIAIEKEEAEGPPITAHEDELDAYEENDIFVKDELKEEGEGDLQLYTIEEGLQAFVDNVDSDD